MAQGKGKASNTGGIPAQIKALQAQLNDLQGTVDAFIADAIARNLSGRMVTVEKKLHMPTSKKVLKKR